MPASAAWPFAVYSLTLHRLRAKALQGSHNSVIFNDDSSGQNLTKLGLPLRRHRSIRRLGRFSSHGDVWLPHNVRLLLRTHDGSVHHPNALQASLSPARFVQRQKIAPVNVYSTCKLADRIDNGVNDVRTQRLGISFAKRFRPGSFDLGRRSFHRSPKHIVLSASVNTDDPHIR